MANVTQTMQTVSHHKFVLKKYKITKNLYFKQLEGTQAKLYLKNWREINRCLSSTSYYEMVGRFVDLWNEFADICGRSRYAVSETQIARAKELCVAMQTAWNELLENWLFINIDRGKRDKKKTRKGPQKRRKKKWFRKPSLGNKFHHTWHICEYMDIYKCSLGWCDEQSV